MSIFSVQGGLTSGQIPAALAAVTPLAQFMSMLYSAKTKYEYFDKVSGLTDDAEFRIEIFSDNDASYSRWDFDEQGGMINVRHYPYD